MIQIKFQFDREVVTARLQKLQGYIETRLQMFHVRIRVQLKQYDRLQQVAEPVAELSFGGLLRITGDVRLNASEEAFEEDFTQFVHIAFCMREMYIACDTGRSEGEANAPFDIAAFRFARDLMNERLSEEEQTLAQPLNDGGLNAR